MLRSVLLTEPGIPGGHSAVLSITFTLQLLSLQTGHPSHVVTNFCQHGLGKRGVKGSHQPSGRWWIWVVAHFTQSRNGTNGKSRVLEHDFVCLMGSLCGNHTHVQLQSFNVGERSAAWRVKSLSSFWELCKLRKQHEKKMSRPMLRQTQESFYYICMI